MISKSFIRPFRRAAVQIATFTATAFFLPLCALAASAPTGSAIAFPGAVGYAAHTAGGRGGQIIRVTTLAPDGPGSLVAALETKGPRVIVFEVGGVIDLQMRELKITEPFLTVAGQTAPSPGITLIRTGFDILTHDVILQHIRIRTGSGGNARTGRWDPDAISTVDAYNIIVDHCSLTWAIDENLSASGPRFTGANPDEWRKTVSHSITFSNNLIAEGLAHSTHPKGEHSKGSLIHDNVNDILIIGNLYAHNYERNPLFKGGVRGMVINNLIYDPGPRAVHYNLIPEEWYGRRYETGRMALMAMYYAPARPRRRRLHCSCWADPATSNCTRRTTSPWTGWAIPCRSPGGTPRPRRASFRRRGLSCHSASRFFRPTKSRKR